MSKPDCYKCQYRGEVPGSAHSSCHHPAYASLDGNPLAALIGILGKRAPLAKVDAEGITVKGNENGIRHGWFQHPFNFDPVWLEECTGFKTKEPSNGTTD